VARFVPTIIVSNTVISMPRKYQHSAGFEELPRHNSLSQILIKHGTAMCSSIGHSSASSSHPAEMLTIFNVTIPCTI